MVRIIYRFIYNNNLLYHHWMELIRTFLVVYVVIYFIVAELLFHPPVCMYV